MSLSRRSFLKGTAAATVAVALGRIPDLTPAPKLWGLEVAGPFSESTAMVAPGLTKMHSFFAVTNAQLQDSGYLREVIDRDLRQMLLDDDA